MPGIVGYTVAVLMVGWTASWAWMAYRGGRNLRLAIRRGKSAPYIAAWVVAVVLLTAVTAALVYFAWDLLTAVERYGEHL